MSDTRATPDDYILEHVKGALACDPRTGVLDLVITISDATVHVAGEVETRQRRDAVADVLAELLPEHRIRIAVAIREPVGEGPEVEELP